MSSKADKGLISVNELSKSYHIYEKPADRLKQIILGSETKKYYREFKALENVSFDVQRGSSFGVIGKNGAGKSTLLQLITGTLEPSSGSIYVNGKVAAVLELGAGFNTEFSGRENIELYCNLLMMDPKSIRQRFDAIVEFSDLAPFIDQPLKTYSSGMVARLAFSVIAHVDADILIVDEALSVGDAAFSQKCMRFLREFKKKGSIFFVSHDLGAVKAFCDSAIWLDNGKIRSLGEAAKVCDEYLAEVYPNNSISSDETLEAVSRPESARRKPRVKPKNKKTQRTLDAGALRFEGFSFNSESAAFGNGKAEIISVQITDDDGFELHQCRGQSDVHCTVRVRANATVARPIVGFFVKDRLGQPLFGGNTYSAYEDAAPTVAPGEIFEATFSFRMPTLLVGEYSITAAVAAGTLQFHEQLHWMHDAALFKVTSSSLDGVLVGIPIDSVELTVATS